MKRVFIDADKCVGCKNCSAACMQAHRGDGGGVYTLDLRCALNESRNHITLDDCGKYAPIFCRHCDKPECAISCMSGAMAKDPESGHVYYDEKKCAACFMCVMNCPYGVPKPDRAKREKIVKCDFCKDDDQGPNCVRMCPTRAIHVEEANI
jgi:carbon-monoxide dehydrogenase iron sulfur subunit